MTSRDKTGCLVRLIVIAFLLCGFNRENDPSKVECLDCHDDIKAELELKYLHYPVEAKQCNACHDAKTFGFTEEGRGLCTVCHRDFSGESPGQTVHEAIEDCTNCHKPHASANPGLLIERVPALCFSCHEELKLEEKPESVHAPFEEGECLACHNPHTSPNRELLNDAPWPLCKACHDYTDPAFNRSHLNLLTEGTDCLSCHKGHFSPVKNLVIDSGHSPFTEGMCDSCHIISKEAGEKRMVASGPLLCTPCHTEIEDLLKAKFVHLPAEEDCLNCHGAHGTGIQHNLLQNKKELCVRCHEDLMKQEAGEKSHPPFSEGDCAECHDPHGSPYQGILSAEETALCLRCHSQIEEKLQSSQPHTAIRQGCSGCHEPHKGKLPSLVKETGEALCFRCHDSRPKHNARFVHYPYQEGNCSTCHLPHGGSGGADLIKNAESLCAMCHPKQHSNFPHPVNVPLSTEKDVQPGGSLPLDSGGMIICTTCHVPHSSDNVFLLRTSAIGGELCHQCHMR